MYTDCHCTTDPDFDAKRPRCRHEGPQQVTFPPGLTSWQLALIERLGFTAILEDGREIHAADDLEAAARAWLATQPNGPATEATLAVRHALKTVAA